MKNMKKLLGAVATFALLTSVTASVAACIPSTPKSKSTLDNIDKITGVQFTLNTSKKYSEFNSTIAKAEQFSSKPIKDFSVKYYDSASSQTEITDDLQKGTGKVFIVIVAKESDKNWKGSTSNEKRIIIEVTGKKDLDTITSINDLSSGQNFNPDLKYRALDGIIKNSSAFNNFPLTNYNVSYYDAISQGNEISDQLQVAGKVYVVISAQNDSRWQGSTSNTNRLSFDLNKVNLNTITKLTGLDITVDPTKKYSELNSEIRSKAQEFHNHKLETSDTITWFDSASGGKEISEESQTANIVYVVISAKDNRYWTGSTSDTARISIVINKVKLSTLTKLTLDPVTVASRKYSDLTEIIKFADEFKNYPLTEGYKANFFDSASGGNVINEKVMTVGIVYCEVTAADNDPYWVGTSNTTNRFSIKIIKADLKVITSINDIKVTVDPTKKYHDLNSNIAKSVIFKQAPLAAGYKVDWFEELHGGSPINDSYQIGGLIYLEITAADNDPFWTGKTNRITFFINKKDLGEVTKLTGLDIRVDTSRSFADLNHAIINADEFKKYPLTEGYSINWFKNSSGGESINNNKQSAGEVYVEITADPNNPYWEGHTSNSNRLKVTISKINLNTIETLTGLLLSADNNKKFNDLNLEIVKAEEFKQHPLTEGYKINWYQNMEDDNNINNNNQVPGKFYVEITADINDSYWVGTTQRIGVTLSDFSPVPGTSGEINSMVLSNYTQKNPNIYAGSSNGTVYVSEKRGEFKPMEGKISGGVKSLVISQTDSNIVYAGNSSGKIYKSINGSPFVEFATVGTKPIVTLSIDSHDTVYALVDGVAYRINSNTGKVSRIGGIENEQITSLISWSQGILYAGTASGKVFQAEENQDFKGQILNNLDGQVTSLYLTPDNTLLIGTSQGKIYKRSKEEIKSISGGSGVIVGIGFNFNNGFVYAATSTGKVYEITYNSSTVDNIYDFGNATINAVVIPFEKQITLYVGVKTGLGTGGVYALKIN